MKKNPKIPGIRYIVKVYHEVMMVVLKECKETQAEAAEFLGISIATFQKILRLKSLPNFRTERGKVLAARFEEWSGLHIEQLFPEAFYTKEFLEAPKTREISLSFRLLATKRKRFLLASPTAPRGSKRGAKSLPKRKKQGKAARKRACLA